MVGTEKRPDSTVMIRDSAMQPNSDAASAHDKPVMLGSDRFADRFVRAKAVQCGAWPRWR
jgi:hypothetical protein